MDSKRIELADYIFDSYEFPYDYVDASGWWVLENSRVFRREVYLLEEWDKDSICYIFKVEFEQNNNSIKSIELSKLNR